MISAREILVSKLSVPESLLEEDKPDILFYSSVIKAEELLPSVVYEIREGKKPMDRRGQRASIFILNIYSYFNNTLKRELGFTTESMKGIERELEKRKEDILEYLKDPDKKKKEKPKYRTYTKWK